MNITNKTAYLDELLKKVDVISYSGSLHIEITGIQLDSRKIRPKNCFFAVRGYKENGLKYLGDAIAQGASCVIFESKPDDTFPDIPLLLTWVQVKNARVAFSRIAAAFYDYVTDSMYNIGVTGTNGKTTVVSLIHAIFSREHKIAKIGTLGMHFDEKTEKTSLTTPEAVDIFSYLYKAHQKGCTHLVMEASSVALKLHRVQDIRFSQAVFTTFSGDHLDFHGTMDDYFDSKLILFGKMGLDDWAVINVDDPMGLKILEQLNCRYVTYGYSENADVQPLRYKFSQEGIQANLRTPKGHIDFKSKLVGRVNLLNIMAAVSSAVIKGISLENISAAISEFKPVKGRLDMIYKGDFGVLIDYAHTDDAMERLLQSLRELAPQRLIIVFGAGGSRDKTKRPRMGRAASMNADFVFVTSDNPRQEDPESIVKDIIAGFPGNFNNYAVEVDRQKAIKKAINMAQKGDLIVVAGKGHEDYQVFKDRTVHFDDYEVAAQELDLLSKEKEKNA